MVGVRGLGAGLLYSRPGQTHASDSNANEAFPVKIVVTVFARAVTGVRVRY